MPIKDKEAQRAYMKAYREKNKIKLDAYKSNWTKENAEKFAATRAEWYETNKNRLLDKATAYYVTHKDGKIKDFRQNNADKFAARNAQYKARKLQATPKWANIEEIQKLYEKAAIQTLVDGVEYNVDHIVPLKSKIVCGLHCEANLQILTSTENIKKSNRYWPDMP